MESFLLGKILVFGICFVLFLFTIWFVVKAIKSSPGESVESRRKRGLLPLSSYINITNH